MPEFKTNQPVAQREPLVRVDINPAAPLSLGANRFRLVVVDDSGNDFYFFFIHVRVLILHRVHLGHFHSTEV